MTITIPDPTTPDPPPITVTDQLLTPAALDAIAGSWPVVAGGDPAVRQFRRTAPLVPRTQAARILVLNAVLRAAVGGLPAPTIDFLDFELGASLELRLLAGDRAGVDAWAALIGLPPAAITESGHAYRAQIHGTHEDDVWLGFSWVQVICHIGGTR